MSIRQTAIEAIQAEVSTACANEHRRNYHRLHVRRDGTVDWSEYADQHSTLIDDSAKAKARSASISAIPDVIRVGTGSYACNCDYCNAVGKPEGYQTDDDAIADAVGAADTDEIEARMLAELERLCPVGYFDDEEEFDEAA